MFGTSYLLFLLAGSQIALGQRQSEPAMGTNNTPMPKNDTAAMMGDNFMMGNNAGMMAMGGGGNATQLNDLPSQCKDNCTEFMNHGWFSQGCRTNATCVCTDASFNAYDVCVGCLLQNYPSNLNVSKTNFTRANEVVAATTFAQCNMTGHNVSMSTMDKLNATFHMDFTALNNATNSSQPNATEHHAGAVGVQMSGALALASFGLLVTFV